MRFTTRVPVVLPARVTVNVPVSGPVSEAAPSVAVMVTVAAGRTVSVASFEVSLPTAFVTTHRYLLPSSPSVVAGVVQGAANAFEELTPEARADIQDGVDKFHSMFVGAVAKGRGISTRAVVEKFGDGKVFLAADALQRGMVDRIATLDETITRAASGKRPTRRNASTEIDTVQVEEVVRDVALVEPATVVSDLDLRRRALDLL